MHGVRWLVGRSHPSGSGQSLSPENEGVVRTRDLTDVGIPRCYLA
ncbi:hypothetical protein ABID26_004895 [Mesorhizobium shonense]|uniref:Uncharacterized protein n=1 Tax=Mesorhizobium shonense TaxID=1209948 RepID=A0ABV2HY28_9HYPH